MMMRPADAPVVRDKVLDGVAISDDERLKALRTIDELAAAMVGPLNRQHMCLATRR